MVRRILSFSRQRESYKTTLDLVTIVDEAVKLLRVSLPKRIRIETRWPESPALVLVDSTQIHQVVMNLATNAAHAMPGSGQLTITIEHLELTDEDLPSLALSAGRFVRLSVADSGSGMSPEVLDRLFEPFFTTKGEAGTGLGLSVVHGIVHEHGGAITVDSTLGVGTTFSGLPAGGRWSLEQSFLILSTVT